MLGTFTVIGSVFDTTVKSSPDPALIVVVFVVEVKVDVSSALGESIAFAVLDHYDPVLSVSVSMLSGLYFKVLIIPVLNFVKCTPKADTVLAKPESELDIWCIGTKLSVASS